MENMLSILIEDQSTLKDALLKMEANGCGVLFVVDAAGRLRGSFSDGDARRAILKQVEMSECITAVMNQRPHVATVHSPPNTAERLLRELRIRFVPVVDDEGKITKVISQEDVIDALKVEFEAVIMCGGLGTRLKGLTLHQPKPLLKVGGRPVLETIIMRLRSCGIRRITLAINYLGHMIEDCFGNGQHLGVSIDYIREEKRLGTAGALRLMENRPTRPFLVANGDVLSRINFAELLRYHTAHDAQLTASVVQRTVTIPYGVVTLDDDHMLRELREKPDLSFFVNAGIYAINPDILDCIPLNRYFDMTDLIAEAQRSQRRVATFPIHEYWIDVGQPDDFGKANDDYDAVFDDDGGDTRRVA